MPETPAVHLHYMTLRALVTDMKPETRNLLARAIMAENAAQTVDLDRGGKPFLWNRVIWAIDNAERTDNTQCVQCCKALEGGALTFGGGYVYCGPSCRNKHER